MKVLSQKVRAMIGMLVLAMVVSVAIPAVAQGKTKVGTSADMACKSGRYIYYAYEMSGVRMGIMRLDTKTNKKKQIVSYKYNGQESNGFYNISVKGNYIYATWDVFYGTAASERYIYRFTKDGKKRERLACGYNPMIIGNRIYYTKCKLTYDVYEGFSYTEDIGDYSMNLDGSQSRKESVKRKYTSNNSFSQRKTTTVGNYQYYIGNKGKTLYRMNRKTKKKNVVITYYNGVDSYQVCGNYVITQGLSKGNAQSYYGKYVGYCVKSNGKNKVKLASWEPAE
ncbi:hypothetical protein lbkm_2553 [Lachnospiraceae bacterium KM106-2]|nr:hypothetical protein lbkm_2553 [Lachnospiraceae bacterium KM106-2]